MMWLSRNEWEGLICDRASLDSSNRHLVNENKLLREALEVERERANRAVDETLRQAGVSPITPPSRMGTEPEASMFDEDPAEVKAIQARIEEMGVGAVLTEGQ